VSEQKVCPTCGTEYPLSERFCPRDGTALRSAAQTSDLLGSVVADRYHVIKKLGEGGMGTVYLAEHVKMGRKSALKVMNPGMNSDPDAIARFNREAANASRLSHPNICGIYDFGETPDGLIYLAMEFIEGKALTDLIEADGSLAPARAGSIVHQTADALQIAHDAGIVHRDLKPDNIMVARNRDGSDLVKVVDFGIAKASSSDAQKVTKTGLVVGTPEYMSPEQLAGDKLDGRSDIYSLALVAFNALTGKLPFPSETAQEAMIMRLTDRPRTLLEMRPDLPWPERLQEVMDRGLARDAEERYQSAAQFGRDFAEAVSAMPSVAMTEGATMVIGAAGAAAAPPKPVPATRVAGRDDAKLPSNAASTPAALEKKSNMIPMAVGGLAIVIAGFLGMQSFMNTGDAPTVPDSGSASPVSAEDAPAVQGTQTPDATTPPSAPTGGSAMPVYQSASQPSNQPASQPSTPQLNRPANAAPAPTSATTPTTAPETQTSTPMARISSWVVELEKEGGVTRARARAILGDAESLRSALSGTALSESWYVAVLANLTLEDQDGTCTAARQLKNLTRDQSRRLVADRILPDCS
jgi:serine/threonine-protein kinase